MIERILYHKGPLSGVCRQLVLQSIPIYSDPFEAQNPMTNYTSPCLYDEVTPLEIVLRHHASRTSGVVASGDLRGIQTRTLQRQ